MLAETDRSRVVATRPLFADAEGRATALFYETLFTDAPELRAMFPSDLAEQRRKLGKVLVVAIDGLSRPETLGPALDALAIRHLDYGVERGHYAAVAAAFLRTLETAGADAPTIASWRAALEEICARMIAAAYPEALAAE